MAGGPAQPRVPGGAKEAGLGLVPGGLWPQARARLPGEAAARRGPRRLWGPVHRCSRGVTGAPGRLGAFPAGSCCVSQHRCPCPSPARPCPPEVALGSRRRTTARTPRPWRCHSRPREHGRCGRPGQGAPGAHPKHPGWELSAPRAGQGPRASPGRAGLPTGLDAARPLGEAVTPVVPGAPSVVVGGQPRAAPGWLTTGRGGRFRLAGAAG